MESNKNKYLSAGLQGPKPMGQNSKFMGSFIQQRHRPQLAAIVPPRFFNKKSNSEANAKKSSLMSKPQNTQGANVNAKANKAFENYVVFGV